MHYCFSLLLGACERRDRERWGEKPVSLTSSAGQVPFVVYYSKVGLEVGKIVLRGQNITSPP